jgi:hypothetical protein
MKTSLILFASSILAPAAFVLGLGAAPLIGAATVVGLGAIACQDYGRTPTYLTEEATAKVRPSAERLPLAA